MLKYKVIEKFFTIDGEGPTAGEIATFIRFAGCNLNCIWCDTDYSIAMDTVGIYMTEQEIYEFIKSNGAQNVTLTGGEPLIQKDIEQLVTYLSKDLTLKIHIETNGSIQIDELKRKLKEDGSTENVRFIIDYKLPSSGMEAFMDAEIFNQVDTKDVYKFVVGSHNDLIAAKEIINKYQLTQRCIVHISPTFGSVEPVKIVEYMKKYRMNGVRLQLQLHKIIWSPEMRGV